ncbi:hypothetical protein [Kingella potus]|uniref:hypothetical protein n=1 Tax=Kingella potus TaxID=265175 RepID=UPI001FD31878|nr:hypothetical protein [Kingella potus]UOP01389.1 hypothetical protein LVJ84_03935 [Kingella potus]
MWAEYNRCRQYLCRMPQRPSEKNLVGFRRPHHAIRMQSGRLKTMPSCFRAFRRPLRAKSVTMAAFCLPVSTRTPCLQP